MTNYTLEVSFDGSKTYLAQGVPMTSKEKQEHDCLQMQWVEPSFAWRVTETTDGIVTAIGEPDYTSGKGVIKWTNPNQRQRTKSSIKTKKTSKGSQKP